MLGLSCLEICKISCHQMRFENIFSRTFTCEFFFRKLGIWTDLVEHFPPIKGFFWTFFFTEKNIFLMAVPPKIPKKSKNADPCPKMKKTGDVPSEEYFPPVSQRRFFLRKVHTWRDQTEHIPQKKNASKFFSFRLRFFSKSKKCWPLSEIPGYEGIRTILRHK